MASNGKKPHAVLIPYPAQGHVTPMFNLAKLLHSKSFHVTFVNTEHNHARLLTSKGQTHLAGLPGFRFESIPDGLPPPAEADATQDIPSLSDSTAKSCLAPFVELIRRLNGGEDGPPVTCIVADGAMSFAVEAGREFGVPVVVLWTPSACGFLGYNYYRVLVERGLTPLKDASYLTNGYLDTTIDWIPGMKSIPLRYLPSFIRTTDPDDIMLNYIQKQVDKASKASAVLLNTFDAFEHDVLDALHAMYPSLYTVGPLNLFVEEIEGEDKSNLFGSSLWKEEDDCIEWLDQKEPNSVVYVNFGSITTITNDQLQEFAWGLAGSNKPFLWIIRPDLVAGEKAVLAPEFVSETQNRGKLAGWCPQEQVLKHPSVGGFLSHMGWNSTLESVCSGVPMVCWPFFAEQQTNCWFACKEWGIGMEIGGGEVRREEVEELVKELMGGEKGGEMRKRAMGWRREAQEATKPGGSSYRNYENLISILLGDK